MRISARALAISIGLLLAGLQFLAAPLAMAADEIAASAEVQYNIPDLPMNEAIARFAQTSDVDILYDRTLVEGKRSRAVDGRFTPQVGISLLLQGSGLESRFLRPKSAIIFSLDRPEMPNLGNSRPKGPALDLDPVNVHASPIIGSDRSQAFVAYGKAVQTQIYDRLRTDTVLSDADFRIQIALSLDDEGRIDAMTFLQGTGDSRLDSRIVTVLDGAQLSFPPPRGLPQPMQFLIFSK